MSGVGGPNSVGRGPGISGPGTTLRRSGVTERSPINRLIQIGQARIPDLTRRATLSPNGARLVIQIEHPSITGEIGFEVFALPQPEKQGGFWQRLRRAKEKQLEPVPLTINRALYSDEFQPGRHVQLMAHHPYVVLEDGTHYAVCVTAPEHLLGEWQDFEEPDTSGFITFNLKGGSTRTEVGKKRRSLAIVVRVDDGQPLIRQQEATVTEGLEIYQEMLGGFQPSKEREGVVYAALGKRTTVPGKKIGSLEIGEEVTAKGIEEDLIFSIPPEGTIRGDVEDKKGLVKVVVFLVEDKRVSEIIERPPVIPSIDAGGDFLKGGGTLSYGGGMEGFSAGETTFGKETRRRVDVQGCRVVEPLAAFQVVLVGEEASVNQLMQAAE